jgi:hypothetical protein
MQFFNKKKKAEPTDTMSNHIATYLGNRERELADYLNKRTVYASKTSMLYVLIAFCLVFGGYLIYLISGAFGAFN